MQLKINERGLPLLEQFSEDGFVDCVFQIQKFQSEPDRFCFHIAASFNGEDVGVDIQLIKGIKAFFNENMESNPDYIYSDGVKFLRSGTDSDKLLAAIAFLYKLEIPVDQMMEINSFTMISLHQEEFDIELERVNLKLFGNDSESDNANTYYECYFNVDLANGLVFWNEKDLGYREPLIRSLSANCS
jgi:hypothetical protein